MAIDKKFLERLKSISANINKNVKGASVTWLGNTDMEPLKRFSSQIPSLDDALGGGWPIGKLVEIYGAESTGKTTLCYHAMAQFQKLNPTDPILWVDSEASIDPEYATKLGVDMPPILLSTPDTGEEACNVIREAISGGVKLIVVDSIAALVPQAQKEKQFGERTMGETARLMSDSLKQFAMDAMRADCTLLFTNQVRDKIGVLWGEKTTTPGGRALKFTASIRVELTSMGTEKDGDVAVCAKIRAKCKKNKTFPPLREALYSIVYGIGVDGLVDTFDAAVKYGVVEKKGAWLNYKGKQIACGKAAALDYFRKLGDTALDTLRQEVDAAKATGKIVAQPALKIKKPKTGDDDGEITPQEEEPMTDDFSQPSSMVESNDKVEVSSV